MAHPCARLIQHQQFGLRGQTAGDLKTPLLPIRQLTRHQKAVCCDTDPVEQLLGNLSAPLPISTVPWQEEQSLHQTGVGTTEACRDDVLDCIQVLEQLNI